jgi:tetratricopeptide (TPR) repeat protein
MFFYNSDIDNNLIDEYRLESRKGRQMFLREIAEELQAFPEDYRLFGPYWWFIKEQMRREGIARQAWFHVSPGHDEILEQLLAESPAKVLAAAVQYLRMLQEEPQPLMEEEKIRHLWESGGEGRMTAVEDSGFSLQPDLFAELEEHEIHNREFLNMPDNYIPRIWKEKGLLRQDQGRHFAAYRCFRRYLGTAGDDRSRADAWLLIGLLFQNLGHFPKAVFAFSNAYDRDTQDWILAHLAEARIANGELRDGLQLFEQLVRRMPGNPEYRQRLEELRRLADQPVELEEVNELPFHALTRSTG